MGKAVLEKSKLEKLDQQIKNLQLKKRELLEKRNNEISKIIIKTDLSQFSNSTISNALLFVKSQLLNNSDLAQSWKNKKSKKAA